MSGNHLYGMNQMWSLIKLEILAITVSTLMIFLKVGRKGNATYLSGGNISQVACSTLQKLLEWFWLYLLRQLVEEKLIYMGPVAMGGIINFIHYNLFFEWA